MAGKLHCRIEMKKGEFRKQISTPSYSKESNGDFFHFPYYFRLKFMGNLPSVRVMQETGNEYFPSPPWVKAKTWIL